ncbi:MAG: Queuine tRNA-ribosyltransferase [Parcubacteria group bacterium GW2011_GWC2_45_7]|nr:MAG: Queuine tRNA-ribosyltransferase [Parcubacteria group bacterium GW2011_GWC2_45_7]KKU73165.1 MAG: Queuine tRNA-ribosyltransferase [Parcubacteria group bacterium GW2011_GWA2_47_26]
MQDYFKMLKEAKRGEARVGELRTRHGVIKTPFFMTIATRGAVKTLDAEDMRRLSAPILLSNTYHLFVRPGLEVIKKAHGLHKFMGWEGPILTDSGGYQIFSLARRSRHPEEQGDEGSRRLKYGILRYAQNDKGEADYDVRITKDGAEFIDRLGGRKDLLTPERVVEIQSTLGSDIMMALDVCAPYPIEKKIAREAVEQTTRWAERCKIQNTKYKIKNLLFGIVQGSVYKDLREQSARDLVDLDFDGYAIGGVSVGESFKEKMKVMEWVMPFLPKDKPRYLMGLGKPEEIVEAVRQGVDMFDCVLPTRNARHGQLYVRNPKSKIQNPKFYSVVNIFNEKYRLDFNPIDKHCMCLACTHHSRAYLRHLFKVGEPLALRLASIHNVKFYLDLMQELQEQI